MRALQLPAVLGDAMYQSNLFDDFYNYTTTELWSTLADSTGTVADTDSPHGILTILGAATDNDFTGIKSTQEIALMVADKSFELVARIDFTEANVDDANVIVGLMNAADAAALQNNGAGPAASKNFAAIYKVDGETVWRAGAALAAGTNPANLSTTKAGRTHAETSAFQTLRIRGEAVGSVIKVTYSVDPLGLAGFRPLVDANNDVIEDKITLGTATEMNIVIGAMAGDTNLETLLVDYVGLMQTR